MNETVGKKRDWIKNATIAFLAIMLVLTFFSNTIMNYSLPEVSAQYVTSGEIQAKVRGNGVLVASDPYVVKATGTQTIAGVHVNNGDHVQKGDTLIVLEEAESEELKAAEKQLEQLIDAFELAALSENIDPEIVQKISNGQQTSFQTYKVQIDALKQEIKKLEDEVALFEGEIDKIEALKKTAEYESSDTSLEKRVAYETAVAETASAKKRLQDAFSAVASLGVTDVQTASTKLTEAKTNVSNLEQEANQIKNSSQYAQAEAVRVGYENAIEQAKNDLALATQEGNVTAQQTAQANWDKAIADKAAHITSGIYIELEAKEKALTEAKSQLTKLEEVVLADSNVTQKVANEESARVAYEAAGPDHSVAIGQYDKVISINQKYVDEQNLIIADKRADLTELIAQYTQENTLATQIMEIEDQRTLINELKAGSNGGVIVAPITGTVQDLYLVAGESTVAESQVATILPDGKGFTLEVNATREQAQRLSIGDKADLQNAWYYSEVDVVLRQIKTDVKDPANSRILVFDVKGDVTNGQNLSISIGQKSAQYDTIVPNAAIREDSNGKFVLVVSQKSSPLGNRYFAERIDVQVLGSDDTQSAVTGDLVGWDYVITTSTKPIEAGQLVRLAD